MERKCARVCVGTDRKIVIRFVVLSIQQSASANGYETIIIQYARKTAS